MTFWRRTRRGFKTLIAGPGAGFQGPDLFNLLSTCNFRLSTVDFRVECYAGHRDEETPRVLHIDGRTVAVREVMDAWLAPGHRYFKLKGDDGDTYLVRHDSLKGVWELTMFKRGDAD